MSNTDALTEELDFRLLELLRHHEGGLTMREIFSLLETSEYLPVRYRLRKLGAAGLLKWGWREGEKRFYITRRGIKLLEEAAYEPNGVSQ
ncbi:MAG: hypothetical protein ACXV5F_05445 [Halobacteriota archaeon]